MDIYGISAPLKGRNSKLPLRPSNDITGKPHEAHPPPTIAKSELPPAARCALPILCKSIIFCTTRVIFAPVNIAVININSKDKWVTLVAIPISKDLYNFNLGINEKEESVLLMRTKFRKYVTRTT